MSLVLHFRGADTYSGEASLSKLFCYPSENGVYFFLKKIICHPLPPPPPPHTHTHTPPAPPPTPREQIRSFLSRPFFRIVLVCRKANKKSKRCRHCKKKMTRATNKCIQLLKGDWLHLIKNVHTVFCKGRQFAEKRLKNRRPLNH